MEQATNQPTQQNTQPAKPQEQRSAQPTQQSAQQPKPAQPQGMQPRTQNQRPERKDDNVIYVGKKEVISYVLAVVTSFSKGFHEVTIKARGHLISRAVDVEEIVKHRFMPGVKIKDIKIMTEELQSREGHMSKVSAIEIVLAK